MAKIVSSHPLHPDARKLLEGVGGVTVASAFDTDTLMREACDADIVIVRAPLPEAYVRQATRLKAIIRHGAGLDMIPVEAASERGVLVVNVPGVNANAVAEHVLMTSLQLLRRFHVVNTLARVGYWAQARSEAEGGSELRGKRIGIVGYGHIGQAVASLFRSLGTEVRAFAPRRPPPGDLRADLKELFAESDVVVLCCPLSPETRGLVNSERLSLMSESALLINVARGAVIDDQALLAALQNGGIAGAALDVFTEQPLPDDHPYRSCENVILTPHVAGLSVDSMREMGFVVADEALRIVRGEQPVNLVNAASLAGGDQR